MVAAVAFHAALEQLQARTEADLGLAANRLSDRLSRFGELGVLLADHPDVRVAVEAGTEEAALSAFLQGIADKTESDTIALYDLSGGLIGASNPARIPASLAGRTEFERALDGALGQRHGIDAVTGRRVFRFAHPVFAQDGPVEAVISIIVNVETIESGWRGDATPVYFTADAGTVFLSNRSELIGRDAGTFKRRSIRWPPVVGADADRLWLLDEGRYVPQRALRLSAYLPRHDLTGTVLGDLDYAMRIAGLWTIAYATLALSILAGLRAAQARRRALAARLEAEEAATRLLEKRVAERTADLSRANADLRREVSERKEAQFALQQAQADLVQAGKLSALGQMSAGISHELNQPIMAIQSLAENASAFMERGKPEKVSQNLGQVGALAARMARIVRNLRAFARQEKVPFGVVDLASAVDAALELAEPLLRQREVVLDWVPPDPPVQVHAGEVRLSQVVLNLITNAVDAMEAQPERALSLSVEQGSDTAVLVVRDTGPGLAEPDRIFDPFFTTKEVGGSEGMGLGLSISYGLVQSFGGDIQGRNRPEGGAEFRVVLQISREEEAA